MLYSGRRFLSMDVDFSVQSAGLLILTDAELTRVRSKFVVVVL